MRSGALILTAALLLGCTANAEKRLPREAAVAMTGSPGTLNDISRLLVIEGTGENFNVGQNLTPDAELPKLTVTHFQRVLQFGAGRWRTGPDEGAQFRYGKYGAPATDHRRRWRHRLQCESGWNRGPPTRPGRQGSSSRAVPPSDRIPAGNLLRNAEFRVTRERKATSKPST